MRSTAFKSSGDDFTIDFVQSTGMSRSLHPPWIRQTVGHLLAEAPGSLNFAQPYRAVGTYCVQVLAINEESRSLTISDSKVYVHAFLTKECFDELFKEHSIKTVMYGQVNLIDFCFSTVTQAAGNLDMAVLRKQKVMFPLALHCFKMSYLGASDCSVIGDPVALNAHKEVIEPLRAFKYFELKQRLALAQFPLQKSLPDWGT
jgi:hypothetical protein